MFFPDPGLTGEENGNVVFAQCHQGALNSAHVGRGSQQRFDLGVQVNEFRCQQLEFRDKRIQIERFSNIVATTQAQQANGLIDCTIACYEQSGGHLPVFLQQRLENFLATQIG